MVDITNKLNASREEVVNQANAGSSLSLGGEILPEENRSAINGEDLTGASYVKLSGGDFSILTQFPILKKDGTTLPVSGALSNINLTIRPYSATIGVDDVWLLDIRYFQASGSVVNVRSFWAAGDANFRQGESSWFVDSSFTIPASDDTDSFSAAISTGNSVFVPDGNYLISGSGILIDNNGQSLYGVGTNSRLRFNEQTGTCITCGVQNTTIHDILVSHGRATNTNTNVGIDFGQFTSPRSYNIFVSSMGTGIICGSETFLEVAVIELCRVKAISIVRGQKHTLSNIFVSSCTSGIIVDGVSTGSGVLINLSDVFITGTQAIGSNPSSYALDLFETRTVNIVNTTISKCGKQAIRISGTGGIKNKYINLQNVSIIDPCNESVGTLDAVEIDFTDSLNIEGMIIGFDSATITPRDGLSVGANTEEIKISSSDLTEVTRASVGGSAANSVHYSNCRLRQIDSAGTYTDVVNKSSGEFGARNYSSGGSISPQWSQGSLYRITATSNVIISGFSAPVGSICTFLIVQDATGGRTVSWDSSFKTSWSDSGNTSGLRSTVQFIRDEAGSWTQIGQQSQYI